MHDGAHSHDSALVSLNHGRQQPFRKAVARLAIQLLHV
jgi:hypothetical protein